MNWETIKHIYSCVLKYNYKIEYIENSRYKIIKHYQNGQKEWECEYDGINPSGEYTEWYIDGSKKNRVKHYKMVGTII